MYVEIVNIFMRDSCTVAFCEIRKENGHFTKDSQ